MNLFIFVTVNPKASRNRQGAQIGDGAQLGEQIDALSCPVPTPAPAIQFAGMLSTLVLRNTQGHDEALQVWCDARYLKVWIDNVC